MRCRDKRAIEDIKKVSADEPRKTGYYPLKLNKEASPFMRSDRSLEEIRRKLEKIEEKYGRTMPKGIHKCVSRLRAEIRRKVGNGDRREDCFEFDSKELADQLSGNTRFKLNKILLKDVEKDTKIYIDGEECFIVRIDWSRKVIIVKTAKFKSDNEANPGVVTFDLKHVIISFV
ncbi:hypothetical protein A2335_00550 [Candidatus Peregrinibacteria bacterium RIFOXYB2_FULL_32_7]|nr:MAG: hypothetical protein A2335_00550 [Candidatus Peregrinibacteria bacterium RIFOXYB2_FULL_32_7]